MRYLQISYLSLVTSRNSLCHDVI
ncbi:Bgt-50191 [Blumeria graminis f. sp. tritici]|uniref:Bgt-50191 n=1 Tax=Blumeria graminis f. sp. tritici TaxID=62690 RepID=A0A9X9MEW7_BLUGR|nr:Bgt-50191 [Blumeria graminis f. sp. tritici]